MALSKCALNTNNKKNKLQPHGSIEFPCAAYESSHTDSICDFISWHWHEEFEIIYIVKGTMKLQLLTETFSVHAGEVAVINTAKLHAASGNPYCELQSLVFSPLLITGSVNSSFASKYIMPLISSLKILSELLYKHYGKKTILLIDEYDVPLDKAFQNGYYKEMTTLIRGIFGEALKTNDSLQFAVLTGCLRVSKESIFTGLNNFKVVSITDSRFDEQFGFTDEEVQKLLADYHLEDHIEETKEWYDGYHFGNTDVYCPWDIVNHVDCLLEDPNAEPQSYWINTSGNDLVKRFIDKADKTTRNEIERLIAGDMIEKSIRMELAYDEIDNSIDNLWSILFTTGYLTQQGKSERGVYRLVIPNKEIREVYILQIQEWFKDKVLHNREPIDQLLKAIKEGDAATVEKDLTKILVNTISIFDTKSRKEEKEIFYHGILLGLLRCESEWLIQSNIESGDRLVDILIETEDPDAGIIIELKYAQTFQGLSKACEKAMQQIRERRYDERLRNEGRNDILAYGIAFCKKKCKVVVERL